ncbi:MAG: hypothetical protein AAFR52_02555 [Pseudomonadota bacterium]
MRGFVEDDSGSATLQVLGWIPLLVELMLFTADVSLMYWRHAEMWTVARNTVRQTVSGNFDDSAGSPVAASVEAFATRQLTDGYTATYIHDGTNERCGVVISVAAGAISLTGNFAADLGTISVSYAMDMED